MVNTEQSNAIYVLLVYYNILNIVVNTEPIISTVFIISDYNILNIVVNTELELIELI